MNQRNGFGTLKDQNGQILIEGTFLNDHPDGRVKMWNYDLHGDPYAGSSLLYFDLNHKNMIWKEFEG
jgi:hypothetical protein